MMHRTAAATARTIAFCFIMALHGFVTGIGGIHLDNWLYWATMALVVAAYALPQIVSDR